MTYFLAGTLKPTMTRIESTQMRKTFFKWVVKQQYLQYDVSQYIENPKLGERLPKSFSLQDAMKFEELAVKRKFKERDSLITTLFLLLGLRVSELVLYFISNSFRYYSDHVPGRNRAALRID
jgi:site-specific recombinase XerC